MMCPRCRAENGEDTARCAACGAPLGYTPQHLAETVLENRRALEGERKQVTVLFCDVAGSTALAERVGPDAMHAILNGFFDLTLHEIHRHQGTINQFLGDGFMALFGAPVALEDHARHAALAALAIQRALAERGIDLVPPGEPPLRARIGLNTGRVVVGKIGDHLRMDYTAIGDTTNLAARLQQLAEPGTILLSDNSWRAVRDAIECQSRGTRTVKGRAEPVTVYQALGARTPPTNERATESQFVGRDADLHVLLERIGGLAGGRGGMAAIVGEAGLGKSRLIAEVRLRIAGRNLLWLEGRGLSLGQTIAGWPFVQILRSAAGIGDDEAAAESWARLDRRVRELAPENADDLVPYLATLMGIELWDAPAQRLGRLDAQAIRRQILLASRRFFERLARDRPLVLVLEDLHWVDHSSLELLEHLLPLCASVPILILATARPDVSGPADRLRQATSRAIGEGYVELRLAPLGDIDGAQLLRSLLGADELPRGLADMILGRAEGNPFFLEEVVHALRDMRALVEVDGRWQLTLDLELLAIPDTLQGVILARIDRLDDDVKALLKLASVIGRSFVYRVLHAVAEAGEQLDGQLAELQQGELIRERRKIPELEYVFKHALVQEATYGTILLERKRRLHRRVAECLEALYPERLAELSGVLAYHYSRAEDWKRAQAYLLQAGDQAGRIAADAEALAIYRQALEACARAFGDRWDPVERATLERKIGEALFRRGNHDGALEHFRRAFDVLGVPDPASAWGVRLAVAREILRQVIHRALPGISLAPESSGLPPAVALRCRIYEVRVWINYFLAPDRTMLDSLTLLNVSERNGHAVGTTEGLTGVGMICDAVPIAWLAGWYHRQAVAKAAHLGDPQARAIAWFGLGYHELLCLGESRCALSHLRLAAAAFRDAGELRGWGGATTMAAMTLIDRGDIADGLAASRELIRTGRDSGDPQVWGWGALAQGRALLYAGDTSGAVASLRKAADLFESIPAHGVLVEALGFLGQCQVRLGRIDEAQAVLDESARLIARHGLRDHQVSSTLAGRTETYLAIADTTGGRERAEALKRAVPACRALFRLTRLDRPIYSSACRLRGTIEWLRDQPAAAEKWWMRSVSVARRMEHRHDLGKAHLEMGNRTGRRSDLERAKTIFTEIGVRVSPLPTDYARSTSTRQS